MKNILVKIKKFIPEIIALILIISMMIGYGVATSRLHHNSVYDGNYIGGNSTDVYANVDVKWIDSIYDIPEVEQIEFGNEINIRETDKENILKEQGWLLIDYEIQANYEGEYHNASGENLLVNDYINENVYFPLIVTIENGTGRISKMPFEGGLDTSDCQMVFSNNGAYFRLICQEIYADLYMEKNGSLTAYNYQIVQAVLLGIITLIGVAYIIYSFIKKRIINIAIISVLFLILFAVFMNQFRDDSVGEWRSIKNENVCVIISKTDGKENILVKDNLYYNKHVFEILAKDEFEEELEMMEFPDKYKRFDVIPGYGFYPYILLFDVATAIVFGSVGFISGKKNTNTLSYSWEYPYNEYIITGVKYLPEAFNGMEEYFIGNLAQDKIYFLMTEFSFDETTVVNPVYTHTYGKMAIYNGAVLEKCHNIIIADEDGVIEYDLCFTAKGSYIRKKMDDMLTVVYEIRKKEG